MREAARGKERRAISTPATDPVLIDPLTAQAHRLELEKSGGFLRFEALPLTGYPLIITDKAVRSDE